jgi:pimeloyl-ACP methyl ester carboxylesterase
VGFSTQLLCDVPLDQVLGLKSYDSRDQSADAVASRQTVLKLIADSCAANPLTPYVNTWQTTHDMDLIRALLGESRLNYLGYSYGTWLGAKYAAVFPEHTGKVVLDSNTSWMDDLAVTWELMPMAFQLRWDRQFAPWVTRNPVLAKYLGATPAQVSTSYEQLREAFKTYFKNPVWGDILDSFLRAFLYTDAGFVSNAIILAVYKVCLVDNKDLSDAGVSACINEFVPRFFKELNDTTAEVDQTEVRANLDAVLRGTAGQGISPDSVPTLVASAQNAIGDVVQIPGVFYAVRCGDGGNWHSPQWWVDYARRLGPFLPLGGYAVTQEVCSYWTLPSHRLPNPNAQKVRTIVTVQAEFDPATAYLNVLRDAAQFRGDRLISVDDAGTHGQYGLRGNSCVDDAVNGYLLDDVTPPDRSVCAGLPLPLETSVYPTPGPVDFVRRPGVRRIPIDPRIRHLLDKIIK